MTMPGQEACALIALDSEGEWNHPLLENAAAMSGAVCRFAASGAGRPDPAQPPAGVQPVNEVLAGFGHVIACEAVRDSVSIYGFPAPRGRTAVIVGNETKGIPRSVLKQADSIVAIPMAGAGMSSVNVAVSAAIALYVLSKDLGRKKRMRTVLAQRDVDVLIQAPADPHELGSLLRSAWAFGWRRVFVSDPHGAWFTRDHDVILEGRAAARRARNPLAVLPVDSLSLGAYDSVVMCNGERQGVLLSQVRLPACGRLLVVFGAGRFSTDKPLTQVYVDHARTDTEPRFRHAGSILLSMISEMTRSH